MINLDVEENEQIKRTKKKSGEGGPEVTPEEAEKAK